MLTLADVSEVVSSEDDPREAARRAGERRAMPEERARTMRMGMMAASLRLDPVVICDLSVDNNLKQATKLIHAGERSIPAPRRRSPRRFTRRARSCSTRWPTSSSTRKASWTAISIPATRIRRSWRWSRSWRRIDGAEMSLLFSSGMAAISTAMFTLLKSRRRGRVQRGDLRRHVSPHRGPALEGWHHAPLRLARRSRESRLGDRAEDEDRVVRIADQPDAALRGCSRGGGGVQEGRRDFGDRQHLREPDQPAGARRWASICRCKAARST